jgi:uncharacterized protein YdaU (DUF1376 family)
VNFYKHYIGDFQRDTGHLSLTERGAYLCLIHHYYATEKPVPNDHAALCRVAGAITKPERDAVRAVMAFFTPCDSGLMHARIEAEIDKAGKRADTNREIAIAREAARKAEREASQAGHESSTNRATNREPNQTPDTRHQEESPPTPQGGDPEGFAEFWSSWPSSPRKQDRKKCAAKWVRSKFVRCVDEIVQHVEAMKGTRQWRDGFEPAPLTYLNGERWRDGVPADRANGADHVENRFAGML